MAEHDRGATRSNRAARVVGDMTTRAANCVRDLARGVAGTHAYDQYLEHARKRHPDRPVMTREEFFRREFTEKWDGIRRCC